MTCVGHRIERTIVGRARVGDTATVIKPELRFAACACSASSMPLCRVQRQATLHHKQPESRQEERRRICSWPGTTGR
jgi:hypothetical protein